MHTIVDNFRAVADFNRTFEVKTRTEPRVRVPEAMLRFRLIEEELGELLEAYNNCDIVELADAFGDIEYVGIGAAQVFGIEDKVRTMYIDAYDYIGNGTIEITGEPLLTKHGQEEIIEDLRRSILKGEVEEVAVNLGSLLALNRAVADTFYVELNEVVADIHISNMTKLGADGKPIFREGDRKVLKGPNYTTPTAAIENYLFNISQPGDIYAGDR